MSLRSLIFALFLVNACVFAGAPVFGQGVIVPVVCDLRPCRPLPRPVPLPAALPVKSIQLDTKINGQIATTHVEQVFRNDTPYTLEGTYFFPIPETASIVEFAIWENGKKLSGEVRSREEARRIYDEIVRRQRDPGLLEYAGKDLFQASIFPIPPHSDKKLEITYTETLKGDAGTISYRYPLGMGRSLWNRPMPANISAPAVRQQFGTISGRIEITGRQPLRNIYSPSHSIETKLGSERSAVVSFEARDNDNDLQLYYGLSNDEFGMTLITHREPGKDGYFMLMMSPKDDISDREIAAKDIVFVLDTSGSMAEEGKMEKARAALLFGVRTLRDGDRFNVVSFAGEERLMEPGLIAADAAGRKRAEEFIAGLRPTGGTNINDALLAAAKQFGQNERPRMLVFMTDGQPTVGERDAAKIIANFKAVKNSEVRVFPFGFGYDVNTTLLDRLGSENGGLSDYVQPKEDLEIKVSNFFSRVSSPVLSDIEIHTGSLESEFVMPRKAGDLFKGRQLVIVGRYRNSADLMNTAVTVSGRTGSQSRRFTFRGLDFPLRNDANDFLPRLWASQRVGWLIEQIRSNGETKELRDEVVELGTRYGLVTPYTSYLATDGTVPHAEPVRRQELLRAAPGALAEASGADAVRMSVQQNSMKTNVSLAESKKKDARERILIDNTQHNRFFANKNFTNQNGVWIDAEFSAAAGLKEIVVRFAGDEYFALAANEPELARYFSLGEQVVVVWKRRVYRIVK